MKDGQRKSRRILHTSDWHLASRKDKSCGSLVKLVDAAKETRADLVVAAGDLFDHNSVGDDLVGFVVEQLRRLPSGVVILPGNHDCLEEGSVFDREEFRDPGGKIRVIRTPGGETLSYPDLGIFLWGKPILAENVLPLSGIPEPERHDFWNIALAHGYYVDSPSPHFLSYHITAAEIVNSGWDYIALGHVPIFRCVCDQPVKAYYCGSLSAAGTVAIVDLVEDTGVQVISYSLEDGKK